MYRQKILKLSLLVFLLCACTANQPVTAQVKTTGFWHGVWHGAIAPITFFVSLFVEDIRIYGFPNAGLWYDFGFMLGISGFSGGVFARHRYSKNS